MSLSVLRQSKWVTAEERTAARQHSCEARGGFTEGLGGFKARGWCREKLNSIFAFWGGEKGYLNVKNLHKHLEVKAALITRVLGN